MIGVWVLLGLCLAFTFMSGISTTERRKNQWATAVAVVFFAMPFYVLFDWAMTP